MDTDAMLLAGWAALPVMAFVGGQLLLIRTKRRTRGRVPVDPSGRLEQLRETSRSGRRVVHGRMAEAIRLAESAASPSVPAQRH